MGMALRSGGPAIVDLARVGRGLEVAAETILLRRRLPKFTRGGVSLTVADARRIISDTSTILEMLSGRSPHAPAAVAELGWARAKLDELATTWRTGKPVPNPTLSQREASATLLREAGRSTRVAAQHIDRIAPVDLVHARSVANPTGGGAIAEPVVPALDDALVARDSGGFQRAVIKAARALWPGKLVVEGAERVPASAVLLAPTHGSNLDMLYLIEALPAGAAVRAMVNPGLTSPPVLGALMRRMGMFPVTKQTADAGIARARAMLHKGERVVVYPEQRFVHGEHLGEPRRGLARIALAEGATVVPVATAGSKPAWMRGESRLDDGLVTLVFGEPISFEGVAATGANLDGATERIWRAVDAAHQRAQQLRAQLLRDGAGIRIGNEFVTAGSHAGG